MFHRRVIPLIAVVAVCAVCATPAAAQVSDKDKICSQVENRTFTVGTWASYNWTGGPSGGSTMRMAVVGKEPHEGTTYYWYEMAIEDPRHPGGKMIMQMLVHGGVGGVRSVVMKSGDQPAMRMPPQMIQMINGAPGMSMASEMTRACKEMEVVGWEQVTVPAGQFRALQKDGYRGALSLETHWRLKGGTPEESTRQSMAGMRELLRKVT